MTDTFALASIAPFLSRLAVMALLVMMVIVAVAYLIRTRPGAKPMKDPVAGRLHVTRMNYHVRPGMFHFHPSGFTGIVSAAGMESVEVRYGGSTGSVAPGTTLPVIVDRADPHNFTIQWDG